MDKTTTFFLTLKDSETSFIENDYFSTFSGKDECDDEDISKYLETLFSTALTAEDYLVSPREMLLILNIKTVLSIKATFGICLDYKIKNFTNLNWKLLFDFGGYTYQQWFNILCSMQDDLNVYLNHLQGLYFNLNSTLPKQFKESLISVSLSDNDLRINLTPTGNNILKTILSKEDNITCPEEYFYRILFQENKQDYKAKLSEDDKKILNAMFFISYKVTPFFVKCQKELNSIKKESHKKKYIKDHFNNMAEQMLNVIAVFETVKDDIYKVSDTQNK